MKAHIIYPLLAARRRMLGLSQQELASRVGLRREKINRLESKYEDIGFEQMCRLLDAVGLELSVAEKKDESSAKEQSRFPRSRDLAPQSAEQAAFVDGANARVLNWGKVPK